MKLNNRGIVILVFIVLAFLLGVLVATAEYSNNSNKKEDPVVHIKNIKSIKNIKNIRKHDEKAVAWLMKYNSKLSEQEAIDIYFHVEDTIRRYHKDYNYSCGSTYHVTPRLFVALILTESGARSNAVSHAGAIGMTQVMPLHVNTLHSAGVISEPKVSELKRTNPNIRAGVHILMTYAKGVDTLHRALACYNAGPGKERYGNNYARKVIRLYQKIGGEV